MPQPEQIRLPDMLETEHLRVRKPQVDDAPALFRAYGADADVTRYLRWRPKKDADEMRLFVDYAITKWDEGSEFHHVLELRESGIPIGMIAAVPGEHGVQLGGSYWRALTGAAATSKRRPVR